MRDLRPEATTHDVSDHTTHTQTQANQHSLRVKQ